MISQGWVVLMAAKGRGKRKRTEVLYRYILNVKSWRARLGPALGLGNTEVEFTDKPTTASEKGGLCAELNVPSECTECCPNLPWAHVL